MRCDFVILYRKGKRYKHQCIRCRRVIGWTVTHMNPYRVCRRKGWGDRLEWAIKKIGIRPRCGGCQRRKDRLNEMDRRFYRWLRGPKHATYSTKSIL